MFLIRNRIFIKLDNDENFKFITDNAEFKFTGYDINQIRHQLNKLVQTISILYKTRKQFDSIEVVNIDEVNKTIVENEVMIGTEEAISIKTQEEMKSRINIKEVSNLNIKSRFAKIVDKEDTSDVVEIEKSSKIPVKENLGAAGNQNTDKLSFLPDSINITQLQDITVNIEKSDENLNHAIKDIETAKENSKVVATASE